MKRMGRTGVLMVTVAATVAVCGAAVAAPAPPSALQSGLDAVVTANGGGAIGLVRADGTEQTAASGHGDLYAGAKADPAAQFRIGSNTKAFVSTVLLQLEAEGRLSLDDTVARWLPGALRDGDKVTVRQLLNHTSGIYDYMSDLGLLVTYGVNLFADLKYTPQQLVDIANRNKPYFAPGGGWHYSNTNYILAGMVIRAVTGHDPAAEINRRIIVPLGLTSTYLPTGASKLSGDFMHGYEFLLDVSASNTYVTGTAGGIVSTLKDEANFARALLTGKLLPPKQMEELRTAAPTGTDGTGYGIGLVRAQTPCGVAWMHKGAVLGYINTWMSTPDGRRQVVIAMNVYPGMNSGTIDQAASNTFCAGQTATTARTPEPVVPLPW
ncbi:D-alanyl-D-alanine carboxypeptidase precursor [Actinomadura rubteroloni]|uniref:D-alanyl-D-alanine carboxypeptidase n=1 Tax=Actinomadura rubteroloni TaxID=1926885 RepID=A0A2P4US37_9ACTN|nr:serine hydrolase domain-containing protein [Actinomadura rubteroloni]POM27871.1 D-alanyl-D-alanine carboxypeptidase precursor [Actinomadura rubteroloni]